MGYMEPQRLYQPVKHCLGYALMQAGNPQRAAEVSRPACAAHQKPYVCPPKIGHNDYHQSVIGGNLLAVCVYHLLCNTLLVKHCLRPAFTRAGKS